MTQAGMLLRAAKPERGAAFVYKLFYNVQALLYRHFSPLPVVITSLKDVRRSR
jgi:hypothetical protein